MRLVRKILSMCLVVCAILSMSVCAYAVETRDYISDYNDWPTVFSAFDVISRANTGGRWNAHTCAVQRFLGTYSRDFEDVLDSNGNPDGLFGAVTHQAVYDYQGLRKLGRDGIVGPGTWGAIGDDLIPDRKGAYTYFWDCDYEERVIRAEEAAYTFSFYYYYYSGGQPASKQFR